MSGWRPLRHGVIRIAHAAVLLSLMAAGARGQSSPESLSASFRRAAARAGGAVVGIRPISFAYGLLPGNQSVLGTGMIRQVIPRRAFGSGESADEPAGSGLVIDAERGHVLTNDHVLMGSSQAVVILANGRERRTSQIRRDARTDLALLVIEPAGLNLKTAPWGDSTLLEPGDWVLSIGLPAASAPSLSAGIMSARRYGIGPLPADQWIETDAVVNPASSGGPLVNLKGEVVGVCTLLAAGSGGLERMGYAIPADRARRIAGDLADHGHVRRAYLGVQIAPVELGKPGGGDGESAVVISGVTSGTPAAESGLRPGDRFVAVAGKAIKNARMLQSLIEFAPIGEELIVTIEREGKRLDVKVRPQALPSSGGPGTPGFGMPLEPPRRDRVPGGIRAPGRSVPRGLAPRPSQPPQDEEPKALEPIPEPGRAPGRAPLEPRGSALGGGRL
jgi:serine protease Do